jgi:anti-sigma factor RsiW
MDGCSELRPSIDLLVDGELAPDARPAVEAHLASCASCASIRATLERANALLRAPRVASPSPVEWALLVERARRARGPGFGWRAFAAAVLLAFAIPASLLAVERRQAASCRCDLLNPTIMGGEL